jgi:hypothetical protein
LIATLEDEKDGADAERAREAASRGRENFRATARKLFVTESSLLKFQRCTEAVSFKIPYWCAFVHIIF